MPLAQPAPSRWPRTRERRLKECDGPAVNDYRRREVHAPSTGNWGGTCTCPDGAVYDVADTGDGYENLACHGGVPERQPSTRPVELRVFCAVPGKMAFAKAPPALPPVTKHPVETVEHRRFRRRPRSPRATRARPPRRTRRAATGRSRPRSSPARAPTRPRRPRPRTATARTRTSTRGAGGARARHGSREARARAGTARV